jgi:hypothetical protein
MIDSTAGAGMTGYAESMEDAQRLLRPNQITTWKAQLEGGAADVFGSGNAAALAAIDVKSLHAKIGELTLENDS